MHLVGFIIIIYHDARSCECQNVSATPVTAQYSSAFLLCFPAVRSIWILLPLLPCALKDPVSRRSSWYSSDPPGKCCDSRPTSTWLWPSPSRSFPLHYAYTTLTSDGVQLDYTQCRATELITNKQTDLILLQQNVKVILLVPASQAFPQYLGLLWSRFRQYSASSQ